MDCSTKPSFVLFEYWWIKWIKVDLPRNVFFNFNFQDFFFIWLCRGVLNTAWKVFLFGVFLVCIFPHCDWIRRDTPNLSIFSPNAGKYGPEKLLIRTFSRSRKLCQTSKMEIFEKAVNKWIAVNNLNSRSVKRKWLTKIKCAVLFP